MRMKKRLVPPSPTPRATVATPIGASNLDAIIDEGTLATWLFSGEWRGE